MVISHPHEHIAGPVLVTGGAGYIGGQTVLCLLDMGIDVVVLDDLSTGRRLPFHEHACFYHGRVQDQALVEKILREHHVKSVLHFAGSIKVDESIADPLKYYENNTEGSRCLIEAAVNTAVECFIFSSTAAVYGQVSSDGPVTEETDVLPLNPYGWSKLFTERALKDVSKAKGLQYGILRYFNVAGADPSLRHGQYLENPVHLIGRAIDAMTGKASPLSIFGDDLPTPDGTGVRDYIHVYDLAQAHLAALAFLNSTNDNLHVNLGYGRGHSVREVVKCLEEVSAISVPHNVVAAREGEAPSVVADISRVQKTLKWQPQYDNLHEIIQSALNWDQKLNSDSVNKGQ